MRDASGQTGWTFAGSVPQHYTDGSHAPFGRTPDGGQSSDGGLQGTSAATDRWTAAGLHGDAGRGLARLAGDARLAAVFKQIRAIVGVSEAEMARRLGTDVTVILDFEAGVVDAFPPWPVTARLIERYAAMADVDPSPILARIMSLQTPVLAQPATLPLHQAVAPTTAASRHDTWPQTGPTTQSSAQAQAYSQTRPQSMQPNSAHQQPPSANLAPAATQTDGFQTRSKLRTAAPTGSRPQAPALSPHEVAASAPADPDRALRRRRRLRRGVTALGVPVMLVVAVFLLLQTAPRPLYAFAAMMPGPLMAPMRSVVDTIVYQTAPVKDGLRWIDAGDPRLRKGDRLTGR
jgi:hypothetical protein